jgi:CubicO group peptidase (beta-lactamase class C family)
MILKKINNTIDELVKNMNHGGFVLVASEKEVIYKKCFGYADAAKKIPISFKTQFLAGSVTKQFGAMIESCVWQ